MDVAASIQAVLDEVVLRLARTLAKETGAKNLCLAGGVALNCVANGKVLRDGRFENIWIQPAAGDAGGAVGAALAPFIFSKANRATPMAAMAWRDRFSVPAFAQAEIEVGLKAAGAHFTVLGEDAMIEQTAQALAEARSGRLVPGPNGIRAALARRSLDPG